MLILRVCRSTLSPQVTTFLKSPIVSKPLLPKIQAARLFANDGRQAFTRSARTKESILEKVARPAGETGKLP